MTANTHAYVTVDVLKASLSLTGSTLDDNLMAAALAASRTIDGATGRRFWADADATSVRVYSTRTLGSQLILEIDDLIELGSLKVDRGGDGTFEETWTLGTEFVLDPDNAASNFRPYEAVRVRKTSGRPLAWLPQGDQTVKVTGQFGWADVPDDIVAATSILASKLVKRVREAPFGIVISAGLDSSTAVHIAKLDPDVAPIIAKYSRHRPFV